MCKSAGGAACDAVGVGGAGNFAGGWIVFTDGGVRGTVDGGDLVLRVFQPDMGGFATLTGTNTPIGAIRGLSYENTGLGWDLEPPAGAIAVSVNTLFRYCDDRGPPRARGIVISLTGSPSLTRDTNGDGMDDFGGVNLVCP
jgi:hypothetical protein